MIILDRLTDGKLMSQKDLPSETSRNDLATVTSCCLCLLLLQSSVFFSRSLADGPAATATTTTLYAHSVVLNSLLYVPAYNNI